MFHSLSKYSFLAPYLDHFPLKTETKIRRFKATVNGAALLTTFLRKHLTISEDAAADGDPVGKGPKDSLWVSRNAGEGARS